MCETAAPEEIFRYSPLRMFLFEIFTDKLRERVEFRISTSKKAVSLYKNHAFGIIYPAKTGIDIGLFLQGEIPEEFLFKKVEKRSGSRWVGWIRIDSDEMLTDGLIDLCVKAYNLSK